MKQKAKIYKGKRIVIGDKNLVTKNEIHVNDIPQEGGESGDGNTSGEGGGTELEGEYYLAKPNGMYWKFTCANYHLQGGVNIPFIDISDLTDEEYQALTGAFYVLGAVAYSAVRASEGVSLNGSDIIIKPFPQTIVKIHADCIALNKKDSNYGYLVGAFQDCSGVVEGIKYNGLINLIQVMMSMESGIEVSEEEAILMISERFMLEQISKEEYESYYNW